MLRLLFTRYLSVQLIAAAVTQVYATPTSLTQCIQFTTHRNQILATEASQVLVEGASLLVEEGSFEFELMKDIVAIAHTTEETRIHRVPSNAILAWRDDSRALVAHIQTMAETGDRNAILVGLNAAEVGVRSLLPTLGDGETYFSQSQWLLIAHFLDWMRRASAFSGRYNAFHPGNLLEHYFQTPETRPPRILPLWRTTSPVLFSFANQFGFAPVEMTPSSTFEQNDDAKTPVQNIHHDLDHIAFQEFATFDAFAIAELRDALRELIIRLRVLSIEERRHVLQYLFWFINATWRESKPWWESYETHPSFRRVDVSRNAQRLIDAALSDASFSGNSAVESLLAREILHIANGGPYPGVNQALVNHLRTLPGPLTGRSIYNYIVPLLRRI